MTQEQIQIKYLKWKEKQAIGGIMPGSFPEYLMPFILEIVKDKK